MVYSKVVFYWDQPFQVGWVVSCSIGKKPFSVGLVAQLFQPASNWVETVEKALVAAAVVFAGSKNCYLHVTCMISPRTARLHGSLVMTIPRSDCVSTENGWKSVLLENVNCVNLNHFRLNRLNPIEHDPSVIPRTIKGHFSVTKMINSTFLSYISQAEIHNLNVTSRNTDKELNVASFVCLMYSTTQPD